ncbi:DSPc-domain-containing protein, partial [Polychaeton citri CBS 116435]
ISTVDDSSATEASPGSSPESPPPNTFSIGMLRPRTADDSQKPFFRLEAPGPIKKGRNLKGLAVNTSRQPGKPPALTAALPFQNPDNGVAPSSIVAPSFVKPPTPKRRQNTLGLSIMTPSATKAPPQQIKLAIPPTPGLKRPNTLRHFQSSPSLPLVPGLGFGHALQTRPTLETIISPVNTQPQQLPLKEEEEEQNFDIPQSKEEKPEAYPDGPICVYPHLVDLYAEPTAEQCRQYDVIMNVASEVRNPLIAQADVTPAEPELVMDGGGGIRHHVPKHTVAADPSPTTPKATPHTDSFPSEVKDSKHGKDPEYIHIKWEHNSDIVPDLLRLVRLIDDRVKQNKRIMIHCQCGVSRSASLVVAYGLYKNPGMSVQEAYDAVKRKSKWIGPNMNLIMQLQEFRSSLSRGGTIFANRGLSPISPTSAVGEWRSPFSNARKHLAAENAPMSAIEPARKEFTVDSLPAISPGPSSAPSGLPWSSTTSQALVPAPTQTSTRERSVSTVKSSTYVDPAGHVVPILQVVTPEALDTQTQAPAEQTISLPMKDDTDSATPTEPLASPRSAHFAMTPLQPPKEADPADAFGIMSPTSTEFSNPFDRSSLLASLGMGSMSPRDNSPKRSVSLRTRQTPDPGITDATGRTLRPKQKLRGKISSPSLREQQQLQHLQAKIEAQLSLEQQQQQSPPLKTDSGLDEPLMSPRATEFTQNPFALSIESSTAASASPSQVSTSTLPQIDPRSPPIQGASPITRSIFDVL